MRGNLLCSPYAIDTRNSWVLCSEETEISPSSILHFPNYSHRSPSSGKIGKQLLSTTESQWAIIPMGSAIVFYIQIFVHYWVLSTAVYRTFYSKNGGSWKVRFRPLLGAFPLLLGSALLEALAVNIKTSCGGDFESFKPR